MTTAGVIESSRPRIARADAAAVPAAPIPARRRGRKASWLAASAVGIGMGAGGLWAVQHGPVLNTTSAQALPRKLPMGVSALGRLSPDGEVIALAPSSGGDGRVERLLVAVGDRVQSGQVVAILDPHDRRQAAVAEAESKVAVSRAKLAQTKAGPKPEDVLAQEAMVQKDLAELRAAERDLGRASQLYQRAAGSKQEFEDEQLKYEQARDSLEQARAQLAAIKAVRAVDVQVAEAELVQALASLEVARADLRAAEVRSPVAGRVLRIRTQPGERASADGILDVGNIDTMQVVAEVYEEDVSKVALGQPARVRVPSLNAELAGKVVRKDLVVGRKVIFNNDPVADTDARVVEVRVRLTDADSARVAGLSNARAEVVIDVEGGAR